MQTINKQQLDQMNHGSSDFVLINVLSQQDFNKQHIRTSVNVPLQREDFIDEVKSIAGSKDRDIVVYCASKDCDASPEAAERLDRAGFKNVYDYEGGTKDWYSH